MGFITKLDLSRQSTIHTGTTATWDGSISIGENLYVNNIRINPQGSVRDGDLLFYNQASNTYKRGVLGSATGLSVTYSNGNMFIDFTGTTISNNPRVVSLANLATDGILVSSGNTISSIQITGSSDFSISNANGTTGNPTLGLTNTGVSGGTYGSSSSIPVFTVDSKGRISFVSGATVNIPTNFITYLNGLTGNSQTLVTGNTGSDFNISSVGTTHTFNIPSSSSSNRGLLIPEDWNTFNNKQNQLSGTGFTFVSGTSVSYNNNVVTQSNLTGGTVPYFDGVNLVNNNIFSNGTNIGIGTNSPSVYSILNLSGNLPLKLTSIATTSLPSASNIGVGGLTWNSTTSSLQYSDGTSWNNIGNLSGSGLTSSYIPYYNGSALADSSIRKITVDPQIRIDDRVTIYGQNASNPALYISTYTTGKGVIVESSNTNVAYEYTGSSTSDTTVYKSVKNSAGGYHMWLQDSTQSGQSPNKQIYDRSIFMYTSNNSATTPSSNYGNGLYNLVYSTAGGLNRGGVLRFQYYDIANNKAGYLFGFDASNYSSATSTNITPDGVVIGSNGAPNSYSSLHLASTTLPLKLTSISTASLPSASNIGVGGFTWNNTVGALQVSDGSNWNSLIVGVGLTGGTVPYWNGSNLSNTTLSYDGTDLSIARTTILKLNTALVGSGASLRTLVSINGKRFICSSEEEINYGNLYVGKNAGNLSAITYSYITAIGDRALPVATSDYTTAIGSSAGLNHTTGVWATYVGAFAGRNNTTGARNVYIGSRTAQSNNGSDNVVLGTYSAINITSVSNAIIIGSLANDTNIASNKLYIDSLANTVPLIGGDFSSKYVSINGSLSVGSPTGNTNTILDLQSTTKGLGLPLVTSLPLASRLGNLLYDNSTGPTSGNTMVSDGANWNRVVTTLSGSTIGTVTLVGGTATVSTSKVKNTSVILLTVQGGTLTNVGSPYVSARTAGVSFTITSTNGLDTADVGWLLLDN